MADERFVRDNVDIQAISDAEREAIEKVRAKPLADFDLTPPTREVMECEKIQTVGDYLQRVLGKPFYAEPFEGADSTICGEVDGTLQSVGVFITAAGYTDNDDRIMAVYDLAEVERAVAPPADTELPFDMEALEGIPVEDLRLDRKTVADLLAEDVQTAADLVEAFQQNRVRAICRDASTTETTEHNLAAALAELGVYVPVQQGSVLEDAEDAVGDGRYGESTGEVRVLCQIAKTLDGIKAVADRLWRHVQEQAGKAPAPATASDFTVEAWEAATAPIFDKYERMPLKVLVDRGLSEAVVQRLGENQILDVRHVQILAMSHAEFGRPWWHGIKAFGEGKAKAFDEALGKLMAERDAEIQALAAVWPGAVEYLASQQAA